MKAFKLIMSIGAILILASSCIIIDDDGDFHCERGNGDLDSREIFLPYFDRVEVSGIADVYIQQGSNFRVIVETDENLFDDLERDVRNEKWFVSFDDCVRDVTEFNVYITMPDIRELTISGSGAITGENVFVGDLLRLNIEGSGDIDIAFDGDRLDCDIEGSGNIRAEGSVNEFYHKVEGSGDFFGFGLDTDEAFVNVLGSGDTEITVYDLLDVYIVGSGNVYYRGNPTVVSEVFGSGRVIQQ